ncbi:hypothetical protein HMPREF9012_1803 [Bacteroidetes bacterium oral taxon 272 str. F0290]|nr:hypothetical protein HMPREF9012_1803 [Bacteroidetes bacterium oral taxon 272 str. F0290]
MIVPKGKRCTNSFVHLFSLCMTDEREKQFLVSSGEKQRTNRKFDPTVSGILQIESTGLKISPLTFEIDPFT